MTRAAAYRGVADIGVIERDVPAGPPAGWVRLRVTSAGICGSDLHVFHGALGDPAGMQPGHEVAGVVDIAGDESSIRGTALVATHAARIEPLVTHTFALADVAAAFASAGDKTTRSMKIRTRPEG